MIKYVQLGKQITGKPAFAFYDTSAQRFFEFNANQIWHNRAAFIYDHSRHSFHIGGKELFDFLAVMPDLQK